MALRYGSEYCSDCAPSGCCHNAKSLSHLQMLLGYYTNHWQACHECLNTSVDRRYQVVLTDFVLAYMLFLYRRREIKDPYVTLWLSVEGTPLLVGLGATLLQGSGLWRQGD
jgi:hypothetical protein